MKPKRTKIQTGILTMVLLLISPIVGMTSSGNLKAIFSYGKFLNPPSSPYIETYLAVDASTLSLKPNSSGNLQGEIEVTIIFEQNEKVINFEKVLLKSPEFKDIPTEGSYFMGLQRFALSNGTYDVLIRLRDTNADSTYFDHRESIEINFQENAPAISDILLIDDFKKTDVQTEQSKFGIELVPHLIPFIPKETKDLTFYLETYNLNLKLGTDSKFVIQFYLEDFESGIQRLSFSGSSRETSSSTNMFLKRFDISQLPSGNYNLVVSIKDATNQVVLEDRIFFQRSNPGIELTIDNFLELSIENTFFAQLNNIDSLSEYIRALNPISSEIERTFANNQLKSPDLVQLQKYFYHFWYSRNNTNPVASWLEYKERVDYVNKVYGFRNKKGYTSDRGRVVLQYGRPNAIASRAFEACYLPFEIWEYQQLTPTQRNKRFVFYQGNIGSLDYILIHSDANGEKYNGNWPYILEKDSNPMHSESSIGSQYEFEQFGGNRSKCQGIDLMELYKSPR